MSTPDPAAVRSGAAVVVVTFNRADLLARMLDGLAAQTVAPDEVIVVDNASTDHTAEVLAGRTDLPLTVLSMTENLGGAGGFHAGTRAAHQAGHQRIWLMDDDVVPAPDCLEVLLARPEPCLMAVREDLDGALVEKAAVRFDLDNPLAIRPKRSSVDSVYASRAAMPPTVPVENVAFEGFMVSREVVDAIGLPDPSFFIFYDDVDYALRARRAGFDDRRGPGRGPGASARLQPAARPGRLEGVLHVPQPVRRAPALRQQPRGPAQAAAGGPGGDPAESGARWPGRGAQRDACHARRLGHARGARPTRPRG